MSTESYDLTFRRYITHERRQTAEECSVSLAEVTRCYPDGWYLQPWVDSIHDAAMAGQIIAPRVLDDLIRRTEYRIYMSLVHDHPRAIPGGYLSPETRRLNDEHEADLRANAWRIRHQYHASFVRGCPMCRGTTYSTAEQRTLPPALRTRPADSGQRHGPALVDCGDGQG